MSYEDLLKRGMEQLPEVVAPRPEAVSGDSGPGVRAHHRHRTTDAGGGHPGHEVGVGGRPLVMADETRGCQGLHRHHAFGDVRVRLGER